MFRRTLFALLLTVHVVAAQDARSPIPSPASLKRARDLVEELFAADLKAALTAEAHVKLAATFAKQAGENQDANRYVLLDEAQRHAALGGDLPLAFAYLEDTLREFDVAPLQAKARVLSIAVAAASPGNGRAMLEHVHRVLRESLDADQFAVAREVANTAAEIAGRGKDEKLVKLARRYQADVKAVEEAFGRVKGAIERLKSDPEDQQANLDLGRYYGLFRNRWDTAIPLLALGKDEVLKGLARRDYFEPATTAEQVALADDWWDRAKDEPEPGRSALQARAGFWYEKALPKLAGLNRTKASRRLAALSAPRPLDDDLDRIGEIKRFKGHTDEIKSVALSSDGRFVLSASSDHTARVWNIVLGKEDKVLRGHNNQVSSIVFHPKANQAFTGSWDGTARLWDLTTGQELRRFVHNRDVNGLAIDAAGERLLTGCDNHTATLWNAATGVEIRTYTGHTGFVNSVVFCPDGKHLATGSVDKSVRLYDLATGVFVRAFEGHTSQVLGIAFTPDGRGMISCGDKSPRLWDVATGESIRVFEGHKGYALCLALSADGRRLATGGDDRAIHVWDVATGKEVLKLDGHDGAVTSLAMSPDGRTLVSGSVDRTVRVWAIK